MSDSSSSSSSGIGFVGLLTIVLVVAKLWGKIDWSWWWVFAPILVGWAIVFGVLGLVLASAGFAAWLDSRELRRRRLR